MYDLPRAAACNLGRVAVEDALLRSAAASRVPADADDAASGCTRQMSTIHRAWRRRLSGAGDYYAHSLLPHCADDELASSAPMTASRYAATLREINAAAPSEAAVAGGA